MPTEDRFDKSPMWQLEIEYERFVSLNMTRPSYLIASNALYDLLNAYPSKTMPADFLTPDIEDWARERMKRYRESTVRREIAHIHGFFRWMTYAKGIDVPNPAVVVRLNDKKVKGRVG